MPSSKVVVLLPDPLQSNSGCREQCRGVVGGRVAIETAGGL